VLVHWFLSRIQNAFPVRDLGDLHYFLGIEVSRTHAGYLLYQLKYIDDLLHEVGLSDSNSCSTPMATTPNLSKNMGSPLPSAHQYRQVVGALQYLTLTRPDISFGVNKLAQFMHCPTDIHWQACKCLFRYLKAILT
jgi:hypothetical protein